ncbi:hypothetical protein JCM10908_002696 [Rhodotorula pacifica]|uniref:uncharacterized protein n=1 Tax=Rhodotorula pacifica TaxID=1495444 RepID=UPI0031823122
MTTKAPASAALLAQAVGDVAPFLGAGSSALATPTRELSTDPLTAAPTTEEVVQLDLGPLSWTELLAGPLGSTRRFLTFHSLALVLSTLIRSALFSTEIGFGSYLLENLAPVEREGVRWVYIVAMRAAELAAGALVWKRVRGAVKHDGALFGTLLALVSRIPLYTFEHSYFLLSTQTVSILLLIDVLTFSGAFSLLPRLLPHPPAPRPVLSTLSRLSADPAQYLNLLFSLGLSVCLCALGSFVLERAGGRTYIERNVFEATVPSYLMRDHLTTKEVLEHPSWTIPALRTYDASNHLSMSAHLSHALISSLPLVPFSLSIPSALASPQKMVLITFLLVAVPSALTLWDVLPLTTPAAFLTGLALAARQSFSAYVISWTLESLRRTRSVRNVKIVVYDQQLGGVEGEEVADVIASTTIEAVLETEANEEGMTTATSTTGKRSSPRRKAVLRGEIEL